MRHFDLEGPHRLRSLVHYQNVPVAPVSLFSFSAQSGKIDTETKKVTSHGNSPCSSGLKRVDFSCRTT